VTNQVSENVGEEEVDLAKIINTSDYKAGNFKKSENYISYINNNPSGGHLGKDEDAKKKSKR